MKNKIILFVIAYCFVFAPLVTFAQTPLSVPMGGMLIMSHECACSGGWMMYVWDKTKGLVPVVFQFGISRMNGNYNIYSSGTNDVGSYVTGGTCIMASTECEGGPTPTGTITPYPLPGIGTSSF